jgi:hypothetical protein
MSVASVVDRPTDGINPLSMPSARVGVVAVINAIGTEFDAVK